LKGSIKNKFPSSWFKDAKVTGLDKEPDPSLNKFGIKSKKSLAHWKEKGWIKTDKKDWFQWYCNYFMGRRLGEEDDWQIKRWRQFVARHMGQIKANCNRNNEDCRPKQRHGLLQWAWDSTELLDDKKIKEKNLKKIKKKAKL